MIRFAYALIVVFLAGILLAAWARVSDLELENATLRLDLEELRAIEVECDWPHATCEHAELPGARR